MPRTGRPAPGPRFEQTLTVADSGHAFAGPHVVRQPLYQCTHCGHKLLLIAPEFGCFPASPVEARVLYGRDLLTLTSCLQMEGPHAVTSLCKALSMVHLSNGCGDGSARGIWRNLGHAARECCARGPGWTW